MTYYLTKREYQILEILSEGNTNKQISEKLNISVRTVETFLQLIFKKINRNNRLKLVTEYNLYPEKFKIKTFKSEQNQEEIISLYLRCDLDIDQIATRLNVTHEHVLKIIKKYCDA